MSAVLQKSQQTRLEDLLSTISLLALEAGHIVSDLQDGQTTDLFAPQVYPANHLVLQERKKELMTNDICYRTLSNSLSNAISKQFLANKYLGQSNTAGSMIYVLKWSEKSTPLGRSYSQQQARVRPISDKDCTGWPTASTRDHKGGYLGGRIRNGKLSIDTLDVAAQLAGYPTPKTGTGGGESQLATSNGRESRDQFGGDGSCSGVVYTNGSRPQQGRESTEATGHWSTVESTSSISRMVDTIDSSNRREIGGINGEKNSSTIGSTELHGHNAGQIGRSIGESETESRMLEPERSDSISRICNSESDKKHPCTTGGLYAKSSYERTVNDWSEPDWLYCRDEKYRPIKPSIEPLANGLPRGMGYSSDPSEPIDANNTQEARVMRLKGYGNAIVPQVAASFIKAFMEAT